MAPLNQVARRARTIEAPNGARVVFLTLDYLQVLAQALKWLYSDALVSGIEEEAAIMKLFEPPPPVHDDDYVYLANE